MRGFTLLEFLLALAIFSIGLLGLLQLQLIAQKQLQESLYTSRAVIQAYNLSALWTMFAAKPSSSLAQQLEISWNQQNAQLLPAGDGRWHQQGQQTVISVLWDFSGETFCDEPHRSCVHLYQASW